MSDDYKKDKLEDLFKDNFAGLSDTPAENGWDLPSDDIWVRVDATLRPEKKDRKGLLWWMLGIGLLVIIVMGIFPVKQGLSDPSSIENEKSDVIENLTPTNSPVESEEYNSANELPAITDDLTEEKGYKSNIKEKEGPEDFSEITTINKRVSGVSGRSQRSIYLKSSAQRQRPVNNQNNPVEETTSKNTSPVIQSSSTLIPSAEQENKQKEKEGFIKDTLALKPKVVQVDLLDLLPLKTLELSYKLEEVLPRIEYHPNESIIPAAPKMKGFYVGLETSVLESYRNIVAKGELVVPRFYEEEEPDISLGYGFNMGYQFSKNWSVETGLNYTSAEFKIRSRRQIRYTMVDEQPNDVGELQRNYGFAFSTSNGTVDTDVAVARNASTNIAENDFIGMTLTGKQHFRYLNVPILARYHIGLGRWQLGLKAGIVNRFLLDATLQFESISSLRPGVRLVVGDRFFRKRTLEKVSKYQADFELGAGLRFFLTDQMSIYAEPTFRRSINPSHEGQNFKTFPTVKAIEFGLNWKF